MIVSRFLLMNIVILTGLLNQVIRTEVDHINENKVIASEWMMLVNDTVQNGEFSAEDAAGNLVVIEWEKIRGNTPRLTEVIQALNPILVESYTQGELRFACMYPHLVANEYFLKSLAPFFGDKAKEINWVVIEEQVREIFDHYFKETDFAQFGSEQDIHIFAVVKDKNTGHKLGLIQFLITPAWSYGDVKVAFYCMMPTAENRGLELLLMSSLFKLIPQTKRIFMHTRSTNEYAINEYCSWGFDQIPGKLAHWTDLEYKADQKHALQDTASKKLQ